MYLLFYLNSSTHTTLLTCEHGIIFGAQGQDGAQMHKMKLGRSSQHK
jgi:hypothetical protein